MFPRSLAERDSRNTLKSLGFCRRFPAAFSDQGDPFTSASETVPTPFGVSPIPRFTWSPYFDGTSARLPCDFCGISAGQKELKMSGGRPLSDKGLALRILSEPTENAGHAATKWLALTTFRRHFSPYEFDLELRKLASSILARSGASSRRSFKLYQTLLRSLFEALAALQSAARRVGGQMGMPIVRVTRPDVRIPNDLSVPKLVRCRVSNQVQRGRRLNVPGNLAPRLWLEKVKYWGWRCCYCRQEVSLRALIIEHHIPLARGGTNFIANLKPACERCNLLKGDKRVALYEYETNRQTSLGKK